MSQDPGPAEGMGGMGPRWTADDLAEPTFQTVVGEIEADQQAWAGRRGPPARYRQ